MQFSQVHQNEGSGWRSDWPRQTTILPLSFPLGVDQETLLCRLSSACREGEAYCHQCDIFKRGSHHLGELASRTLLRIDTHNNLSIFSSWIENFQKAFSVSPPGAESRKISQLTLRPSAAVHAAHKVEQWLNIGSSPPCFPRKCKGNVWQKHDAKNYKQADTCNQTLRVSFWDIMFGKQILSNIKENYQLHLFMPLLTLTILSCKLPTTWLLVGVLRWIFMRYNCKHVCTWRLNCIWLSKYAKVSTSNQRGNVAENAFPPKPHLVKSSRIQTVPTHS